MAGLSLGAYGRAGGSYAAAAVPTAANQATGTTINQAAFGIGTSQTGAGPRLAGYGCLGSGIIAAGLLAWLWWTLPR